MEVGLLLDEERRYGEAEKTYTSAMDVAIRAVSERVCVFIPPVVS